jgi:ABC-type microcin C transport system permease subunit YejB
MKSLRSKLLMIIVPSFLFGVILVIGIMAGVFTINYFILKTVASNSFYFNYLADNLISFKVYNFEMYAG